MFPQRCNVPGIQGTFREHFTGKKFLKSSGLKSCICVKSVWFDINKCWSFGKSQYSQNNVSRVFEEHSTNFYFKNTPRNIVRLWKYFFEVKKFKKLFCELFCEIFNIGSLFSWNVFLNIIETVSIHNSIIIIINLFRQVFNVSVCSAGQKIFVIACVFDIMQFDKLQNFFNCSSRSSTSLPTRIRAFTCSKSTIETLEHGVKFVQT